MRALVAALAVAVGLTVSALLGWNLATQDRWLFAVLAGSLPVIALLQWWSFRRRGDVAREVADSLIWTVLFATALLLSATAPDRIAIRSVDDGVRESN